MWFHNVNWVWFKQKSSLCKLKTNVKGQGKKLKFYFASRTHKQIKKKIWGKASNKYMLELINIQGMKLIFFSDSHLAPKFFKVVANSKNAVSVLDKPSKIKEGKRSLMCYKVDTRMDDIQFTISLGKVMMKHSSRQFGD